MRYDPEKPPAPDEWKELDEGEAELMIARYHRSPRCDHPPAPSPRLHSAMHLIVENQAATSDLPIADALRRLVDEGLTRHEAVHAVGSLLSRHLFDALGPEAKPPDLDEYYEEVSALTADAWRRSGTASPESSDPVSQLDDDALIDLLFTEEDRLPRAAVDAIVTRRDRLTSTLVAIVSDPRTWAEPLPGWWAAVHSAVNEAARKRPASQKNLSAPGVNRTPSYRFEGASERFRTSIHQGNLTTSGQLARTRFHSSSLQMALFHCSTGTRTGTKIASPTSRSALVAHPSPNAALGSLPPCSWLPGRR